MATINDNTPKLGRRTKKALKERYVPESPSATISIGEGEKAIAPRPKQVGVNDPALNKEWRKYDRVRKAKPGARRVQPVDPARDRKTPKRKSSLPEGFKDGGSKNTVNTFNLTSYAGTNFRHAPHAESVINQVNTTGQPGKISLKNLSGEDVVYDVLPTKQGDNWIDNNFFSNHKKAESKDFEQQVPRVFEEAREANIPDRETAPALQKFINTGTKNKANQDQVKKTLAKPGEFLENSNLKGVDWSTAPPPPLKRGGMKKGKAKKMADGGEKKFDLMNLMFGGEGTEGGAGGVAGMLGNTAGDVVSAGFSSSANADLAGIKSNQNPAETMKKAAKKQRTGSAISGTLKGAAAGAALGPVGALAGAGIGLAGSLIKNVFGKKDADRAIEEADQEYQSNAASSYGATQRSMGFKKGGKIKGNSDIDRKKVDKVKKHWSSASLEELEGIRNPKKYPNFPLVSKDLRGTENPDTAYKLTNNLNKRTLPRLLTTSHMRDVLFPQFQSKGGTRDASPEFKSGIDELINEKSKSKSTRRMRIGQAPFQGGNFKEGGKIKGKGGPKEDAIDMKIPDGSFIVPAENSAEAMEIGQAYLDWPKDKKVGKDQGGDKVNVSNGEVFFSPDEVDMLKFYGVSLDALAPNSDPDKKAGFKEGGEIESWMKDPSHFKSPEGESYYESNQLPEKTNEEFVEGVSKKKKDFSKILENIPEIMSGIQVAAGATGLALSKKMPDPSVSSELKTLARETKKLSETGMDPSTKNFALKQIESHRRSAMNEIVNKGGTPTEIMAGMTNITSASNQAAESLAVADTETRLKNKGPYFDALKAVAGRKDEVWKEKRGIKDSKEAMYAALFQAGISNMIGAKQYKEHLDYLKKLKTQPSITLG